MRGEDASHASDADDHVEGQEEKAEKEEEGNGERRFLTRGSSEGRRRRGRRDDNDYPLLVRGKDASLVSDKFDTTDGKNRTLKIPFYEDCERATPDAAGNISVKTMMMTMLEILLLTAPFQILADGRRDGRTDGVTDGRTA